ncbi:hypothetical protein Tco_0103292 [Tanacetum coccineum]
MFPFYRDDGLSNPLGSQPPEKSPREEAGAKESCGLGYYQPYRTTIPRIVVMGFRNHSAAAATSSTSVCIQQCPLDHHFSQQGSMNHYNNGGMWNRMVGSTTTTTTPTLAPASSLGLFSGRDHTGALYISYRRPVDWEHMRLSLQLITQI